MPESEQQPEHNTSLDLWRTLRSYIAALLNMFGGPGEIALRHTLTRTQRDHMQAWLGQCEALLRRLLFIDAVKLTLAPAKPRKNKPHKHERKLVAFDPETPELWRVSFALGARGGAHTRISAAQALAPMTDACVSPRMAPRFYSAWPIALRVEALIRAFNNPGACAKRLARLLQRGPALVKRLTRPVLPRPKNLTRPGDFALDDAARFARAALCDTS